MSLSRMLVLASLAVALVGAAACGSAREPALPAVGAESLGLSPAGLDRIDGALQAMVDSGQVPGVYAVIARHGRIGYERTFGWRDVEEREPMGPRTLFHVYSMTKPVVAAGILRLVDEGRVGLDDPVSKYIPAFERVKVFAGGTAAAPVLEEPASPVTVRQLLNHTSGLAYGLTPGAVDTLFRAAKLYQADRPLPVFADSLATIPLLFHPGTEWSYGSGLDVAGRVIEVVSGMPLDAYLERALFEPLGMDNASFRIRPGTRDRVATVYRPTPDGGLEPLVGDGLLRMFEPGARFLWGSGGLLATPDDYLRFAQMLLNGGALDGTRILRPESVELMTRNTLPPSLTPVPIRSLADSAYGFGLGVAVKVDSGGPGNPAPAGIYRWSGYLGTYFWVDPVNDLVAMVWTQLSPGSAVPLQDRFQELVYDAALPTADPVAHEPAAAHEPSTYVFVHGAWGGAWDWRTVDDLLTDRGHRVHRPTLTGLGKRSHLASPEIGLETHIQDVVNEILWEELTDVVLVGHSYGGMVITGVADRVPDRIRELVYVDAFVPDSGESVLELSGSRLAASAVDGMVIPVWEPAEKPVPKDVPHPLRTLTDPLELEHGAPTVPGRYILTRQAGAETDAFQAMADRAAARGWPVTVMEAGHVPNRTKPQELVELLLGK